MLILPLAVLLGWGGQYADRLWLPGFLGTMLNGRPDIAYFPLLPWLSYVPFGILWGRVLARWRSDAKSLDRLALALLPVGLACWLTLPYVPPSLGYRHPRLAFMLFSLGGIAWVAAALYAWERAAGTLSPLLSWLRYMGKETLMLYVLHHLLGSRLLYWLGGVTGRSWRGQYGVLTVPSATALLVMLLGIMAASAWAWARWKAQSGEWQLRARAWL